MAHKKTASHDVYHTAAIPWALVLKVMQDSCQQQVDDIHIYIYVSCMTSYLYIHICIYIYTRMYFRIA